MFDVALANWYGDPPGLCVHSETCGLALALEHTGDLYSCDHFVEPAYKLGNIRETRMIDLIVLPQQQEFGRAKRDTLPPFCLECDVRFACHGGCPKDRFTSRPTGTRACTTSARATRRSSTTSSPRCERCATACAPVVPRPSSRRSSSRRTRSAGATTPARAVQDASGSGVTARRRSCRAMWARTGFPRRHYGVFLYPSMAGRLTADALHHPAWAKPQAPSSAIFCWASASAPFRAFT